MGFIRTTSLLAITLLAVGCGSPYVNIPSASGDLATHNPNGDAVRDVTADALSFLITQQPPAGPITVELPEGSNNLTTAEVIARAGLGDLAYRPDAENAPPESEITARYRVTGVRIRGYGAQVDVGRSVSGRPEQVTTVYLSRKPFTDWKIKDTREWRVPVDRLPQ